MAPWKNANPPVGYVSFLESSASKIPTIYDKCSSKITTGDHLPQDPQITRKPPATPTWGCNKTPQKKKHGRNHWIDQGRRGGNPCSFLFGWRGQKRALRPWLLSGGHLQPTNKNSILEFGEFPNRGHYITPTRTRYHSGKILQNCHKVEYKGKSFKMTI